MTGKDIWNTINIHINKILLIIKDTNNIGKMDNKTTFWFDVILDNVWNLYLLYHF
jgi:hypothetical protein